MPEEESLWTTYVQRLARDDRDEDDERAAGRVHVRGFYFVVRCALEVLQNNKAALHICAALALFPASGVSKRFLHLVGSEQGFDEHEKECALNALLNSGLVSAFKAGPTTKITMHQLVQAHVQRAVNSLQQSTLLSTALKATKRAVESTIAVLQGATFSFVFSDSKDQNCQSSAAAVKFVESEAYTRGPRDIPFNADVAFELDKVMSSIRNADLNKLEVSWQDRLVFLNCTFILRKQLGVTRERGNRNVALREVKHLLSSHQLDISLQNLPQALFSSWCGMLPFDVFQTAARQLKRLPLGERAHDDLLAKAVFLLDHGVGYYLIIPLVTALNETLPGLLKCYSDTGNFSCLFTVLQCCGHLIRECKMEIAEMFMLQAIKLWLPRHNQESRWGDVLDVCASVRILGNCWADSLCLEKAHWWWELAFLLHMEVMQAVKTITKPLRLCADSLRMCALFVHRPSSLTLFCKWFQRGVGLLQSVVEAGGTLTLYESARALKFFLYSLKYLDALPQRDLSEIKRLVKESAFCLLQDFCARTWKYQDNMSSFKKMAILSISAFLQSKSQDTANQWASFFEHLFQ